MAAKTQAMVGVVTDATENLPKIVAGLTATFGKEYDAADLGNDAVLLTVIGQSNASERENMKAFISGMAFAATS